MKMRDLFLVLLLSILCLSRAFAQQRVEHVVIITTDGLRWQELFKGMDQELASDKRFNQGDSAGIAAAYWDDDLQQRRARLLPFLWGHVAQHGQVYGNRAYGNKVEVTNPYRISSPGYSELFCGYVDPALNSNALVNNPNVNLLEFLNKQPGYKGRVAAFGAWEAFPYILNEQRSKVPVVAAFEPTGGAKPTANEQLINQMSAQSFRPWGEHECLDVFTHRAAMEHLKTRKPRVLYIAYGETDEFAHAGQYKHYLNAANRFDSYVKEVWEYLQQDKHYKDKTLLFIATDHGRGDKVKHQWTSHGRGVEGAEEAWFALLGPGVGALGELKAEMTLYQKQVAQTLAGFLGLKFEASHGVAEGFAVPAQ